MSKVIGLLNFALTNFGPIITFYAANHFFGLKVAVLASVVWTLGEIVFHIIRKKPILRVATP